MAEAGIKFSRQEIWFGSNMQCCLDIENLNQGKNLLFKIKTTKLKTYEVKPPIGIGHFKQKKSIEFKIVKQMSPSEIDEAIFKDKFRFEFLIVDSQIQPKSKQQFKDLWEKEKAKDSAQAYWNFTFPVHFQGHDSNLITVANSEPFSPIRVKSSAMASEVKKSNMKKAFPLQEDEESDERLSMKFQELKRKEEELINQRSAIFKPQFKEETQKLKGGQIALIVLAFLLSVVIGNFLRLRVFVEEAL